MKEKNKIKGSDHQLRIAVILPGVPDVGRGGGGNFLSSLIDNLAKAGHDVHVVAVVGKHGIYSGDEAQVGRHQRGAATIHPIRYRAVPTALRRFRRLIAMWNDPEAVFAPGEAATRPYVTAKVKEIAPDCVFAFSPDPLVYVQDITDIPVLALMSETMQLNMATSLRFTVPPVRWTRPREVARRALAWLEVLGRRRLDFQHLRAPSQLAFSAPHYLDWARQHGFEQAVLIRNSTPDSGGPDWREKRAALPPNPRPRILMIGHLHSTNNSAGLPMLFEQVLPRLRNRIGSGGFEIHIVGNFDGMPDHFRHWLNEPDVIFRGAVTPADEEFRRADIVLVTVPAKSGPRTRILSAFTFGACVVAHSADAFGIPELRHGANCLLGRNGREIADCIAAAAADPALRVRLGDEGRALYERLYMPTHAGQELERILTSMVEGRWTSAVPSKGDVA